MSRPFRKFLYALAALAVLVAAGLAVVSSSWFHGVLERRVTARLEALTGARVEIGQMRFNPFVLEIAFHNLVLHGSEQAPQPPLFSANSLVVRFSPRSIYRRRLILGRLDVNGAEAHLLTRPDGSTNLPGPAASPETGSPIEEIMDWSVGRLTLSHTTLYWNNEKLPLDLSARNVALQLRRVARHHFQGSLSSGALALKAPDFGFPMATVSSRFEIVPGEVNVTALNWRADGFTGSGVLHLSTAPETALHLDFKANSSAAEIARIFKLQRPAAGSVSAEGKASYEHGTGQAQGRIRANGLHVSSTSFDPGPVDFSSDFRVAGGKIRLFNMRASVLGGNIEGKGEVLLQPGAPRFSLQAELRGLHLGAALTSLAPSHPLLKYLHWAAAVQGKTQASWKGKFEDLKSQFDMQFQTRVGAPANSLPVNGQVSGSVSNGRGVRVELQTLEARTPHSTLEAHGTILGPQSELSLNLATTDFEEWRSPVQFLSRAAEPIPLVLKEPATFTGSLSGTLERPALRGRFAAGKFDYRDWNWNELSADVQVAPDSFQITGGRLRSAKSVLSVDASATLQDWLLDPNGPARIAARAEQTPLAGLKAALGLDYPVTGLATGQIEIEGTPSKLTGGGAVEVDQGTLAGRPFDNLSARLEVAQSVWNVGNIQVVRGPAKITGQGHLDPSTRVFSVELHGAGIPLSDFESPPPQKSAGKNVARLGGTAAFDLKGRGTPENVQLNAQWNVQDLKVMGMAAGTLQGQMDWQGRRLQISGESNGAGGALHFSGEATTAGDWPLSLTGEFSDFRLGPWIRLLMNAKFEAAVTGSGTVKISGPLLKPAEMAVESRVRTLQVNSTGLEWTNAQPVEIQYAGQTLKVGRFRIQGPSTNLEAEGSIHFGKQPSLSLTAQGESDAKLLSLLDPAVNATGSSKVNLRINGTPSHPLVYGSLEVRDLNLTYGDFPFRLLSVNGEIQLEGERATIRSLRGLSGGGSVTAQGFLTFAETPRFEINAKVDQVRVQYPPEFTSQLTGTLRLSGTAKNSRLEGDLIVRQLFTSPGFNVMNLVSEVGSPGGAPGIGAASPVAAGVRLNVQVFSAPTVRLETQDLRLLADIDLRLQGTLANPVVVGSIHVLNGETVLRGNRYKINRADISMTNPFRTQPVLDLEATTRVQRYDLTLDISGPLDQIRMSYRSDPPLPTADILSLLALGYSRQQGELATTGQEHFSSVGASALLSEALSSPVTGRIQRLFGVSRIKIDPNVGGPENVSGARVTVEQQVTRDLTLTYITDTGSSQRRVIQFEWQVSDNVSLLGIRDRNGIFGLEVKFRRRFR